MCEFCEFRKEPAPAACIDLDSLKIISKKKQLQVAITNRSFVITDKHFIPRTFYQQWEDGKSHHDTRNCHIVY